MQMLGDNDAKRKLVQDYEISTLRPDDSATKICLYWLCSGRVIKHFATFYLKPRA